MILQLQSPRISWKTSANSVLVHGLCKKKRVTGRPRCRSQRMEFLQDGLERLLLGWRWNSTFQHNLLTLACSWIEVTGRLSSHQERLKNRDIRFLARGC